MWRWRNVAQRVAPKLFAGTSTSTSASAAFIGRPRQMQGGNEAVTWGRSECGWGGTPFGPFGIGIGIGFSFGCRFRCPMNEGDVPTASSFVRDGAGSWGCAATLIIFFVIVVIFMHDLGGP